ncbi:MAG: phosphoribosylglycinamide formyltransferase [Ruminococcaceae bacterium]|nr:phosphoribosylglycinamide formyltransferase [Oscillospiraceae bacterium]
MLKDKKVRIAVMVSGGGTNLQALIDSEKAGTISSGEIVLVLSNKADAYALTRAQKAGIKAVAVTRAEFGADFENKIIKTLEENNIDLIVLAGFMCILSRDFTDKFEKRIINIHPSLIPSFCGEGFYGLRVHSAALEKGVKVTGATVHFVNEIPDGGEIIMQKAVEVLEGDTPETLSARVLENAEWKILPAATQLVCEKILKGEI